MNKKKDKFYNKVYNLISKTVEDPTNESYVSNEGIFTVSGRIAIGILAIAIIAGIQNKYALSTIAILSISSYIGTFLVLFLSLKFGKIMYKKITNEETKKQVILILLLLIILILILPFVMVYIFKLK